MVPHRRWGFYMGGKRSTDPDKCPTGRSECQIGLRMSGRRVHYCLPNKVVGGGAFAQVNKSDGIPTAPEGVIGLVVRGASEANIRNLLT
jgi:hypothetical protein